LADYLSLFQEHVVPPISELANNIWGDGDLPSLRTGTIAMTAIGAWDFGDIVAQQLPIGVFPGFMIKQAVQYTTANGIGIFKQTRHPKEAWQFLSWATQTAHQLRYATFGDLPSDKSALQEIGKVMRPAEFAGTMLSALPSYRPGLLTQYPQLDSTLGNVVLDMVRGKYGPAEAAATMEKKGNGILSTQSP
jgi:ABC-type glycerol-3-phosphate transport system substrate-binding protein